MASTDEIVDGLLEDLGAGFDRYRVGDRLARIYDKHGPDAAHHGKIARDYFEKSIALAGKAMNVTEQPPAGNETALAKQHSSKLSPRGEQLLKRSRSFKDAALLFKQAQGEENREHNERFPIPDDDYEWEDKVSDAADAENMDESVSNIADNLLEDVNPNEDDEYDFDNQYERVGNRGDRYHVTPARNLRGIAAHGLLPNENGQFGFNFNNAAARNNSEGGVFYSARLADAKKWVGTLGKDRGTFGKAEPATAVVKAKDPDPEQFNVDGMGNRSEQVSYEPMPTDKLDVWHAKTGWTPLGAHDPARWGKVKPGHLRLDAKPKGQMQLFPKELYNEAVMNIVNELLAETTFLQAYKRGNLSGQDIKNMSAIKREASSRFGQNIPVLSTDSGTEETEKYDISSRAIPEYDVINMTHDSEYETADGSPTEKLHGKLSTIYPHVMINVSSRPKGWGYDKRPPESERAVEVLGHELGHIIDPVQNEEAHVLKDRRGRRPFAFDRHAPSHATSARKAVVKSEGRAWRVGKDLQTSIGAFDKEKWENTARTALRSYTGNHVDVDEAVNTIVNDLLDETTFLKAYKSGDIDQHQFKAMSAMRKEASSRFGQKIPVLSTDELHGYDGNSRATTVQGVINNRARSTRNDVLNMIFPMTPHSPTEALAHKLKTEKPNVKLNVGYGVHQDDAVHVLGHELGHIVDPVQNTPDHAMDDMWGRQTLQSIHDGDGNPDEPFDGVRALMKSEGRAWRVGKDLQQTAAPHTLDGWEKVAGRSLRSYTGTFVQK